MRLVAFASLVCAVGASSAIARPDGPDWEFSGGPGREDCTACHFDGEAVRESRSLVLSGLPKRIKQGRRYALVLVLKDDNLRNAGFVIRAATGDEAAGEFQSADARTEASGAQIRSTIEGSRPGEAGAAAWRFVWIAPVPIDDAITFHIAANAANDDASPFGDTIYVSTVVRP